MIIFETKRHIEIDETFQGINLTEFHFKAEPNIDNDQIVNTFIGSSAFTYDSLLDSVKRQKEPCWYRAFNFDKIRITDFKKYSNEETTKFLIDLLNEPDWADDRIEFSNLLDKYFEIHAQLTSNDFYVISKDWFDVNDERLIELSWVYAYYFLIISIDRKSNLLTFTEWIYD